MTSTTPSSSSSAPQPPPLRRIAGFDVSFPLPTPLAPQLALMNRVLTSLSTGTNSLLESPTGTGKTLALLSAALAYQHRKRAELVLAEREKAKTRLASYELKIEAAKLLVQDKERLLVKVRGGGAGGGGSAPPPLPPPALPPPPNANVEIAETNNNENDDSIIDLEAEEEEKLQQQIKLESGTSSSTTTITTTTTAAEGAFRNTTTTTTSSMTTTSKALEVEEALKQYRQAEGDLQQLRREQAYLRHALATDALGNGGDNEKENNNTPSSTTSTASSSGSSNTNPAAAASSRIITGPRIYYASRTHTQLAQVTKELRRCSYYVNREIYTLLNGTNASSGGNNNDHNTTEASSSLASNGTADIKLSHAKRIRVSALEYSDASIMSKQQQQQQRQYAASTASTGFLPDVVMATFVDNTSSSSFSSSSLAPPQSNSGSISTAVPTLTMPASGAIISPILPTSLVPPFFRMSVLASRSHACVNPAVNPKAPSSITGSGGGNHSNNNSRNTSRFYSTSTSAAAAGGGGGGGGSGGAGATATSGRTSIDETCKTLVENAKCKYQQTSDQLGKHLRRSAIVWDIEDAVAAGCGSVLKRDGSVAAGMSVSRAAAAAAAAGVGKRTLQKAGSSASSSATSNTSTTTTTTTTPKNALTSLGTSTVGCPYFATRTLHDTDNASIIFVPYQYLVDASIRSAMKIKLEGAIVIIDEAHNIEDTCREAASAEFVRDDFDECRDSFASMRKANLLPGDHSLLENLCISLLTWFDTSCRVLGIATAASLTSKYPTSPLQVGSSMEDDTDGGGCERGNDGVSSSSSSPLSSNYGRTTFSSSSSTQKQQQPSSLGTVAPTSTTASDGAGEHTWTGRQAELMFANACSIQIQTLLHFLNSLTAIESYMSGLKNSDPQVSARALNTMRRIIMIAGFLLTKKPNLTENFSADYKMVLKTDPPPRGGGRSNMPSNNSRYSSSTSSVLEPKLCFWCLSPAVAFAEIATQAHSVILTSGTLAPLDSLAGELGFPFPNKLEAPHVIKADQQVWSGVVGDAWLPSQLALFRTPQTIASPGKTTTVTTTTTNYNNNHHHHNHQPWPWHIVPSHAAMTYLSAHASAAAAAASARLGNGSSGGSSSSSSRYHLHAAATTSSSSSSASSSSSSTSSLSTNESSVTSQLDKSLLSASFISLPTIPLNGTYKALQAPGATSSYLDGIGTSILSLCTRTPGGVLVFFPSYRLLEQAISRWDNASSSSSSSWSNNNYTTGGASSNNNSSSSNLIRVIEPGPFGGGFGSGVSMTLWEAIGKVKVRFIEPSGSGGGNNSTNRGGGGNRGNADDSSSSSSGDPNGGLEKEEFIALLQSFKRTVDATAARPGHDLGAGVVADTQQANLREEDMKLVSWRRAAVEAHGGKRGVAYRCVAFNNPHVDEAGGTGSIVDNDGEEEEKDQEKSLDNEEDEGDEGDEDDAALDDEFKDAGSRKRQVSSTNTSSFTHDENAAYDNGDVEEIGGEDGEDSRDDTQAKRGKHKDDDTTTSKNVKLQQLPKTLGGKGALKQNPKKSDVGMKQTRLAFGGGQQSAAVTGRSTNSSSAPSILRFPYPMPEFPMEFASMYGYKPSDFQVNASSSNSDGKGRLNSSGGAATSKSNSNSSNTTTSSNAKQKPKGVAHFRYQSAGGGGTAATSTTTSGREWSGKNNYNNNSNSNNNYNTTNTTEGGGDDDFRTGAILFAVCRGKAAEGIDFSDAACRTVVLVGIPFSSMTDLQIKLKRDFQNDRYSKAAAQLRNSNSSSSGGGGGGGGGASSSSVLGGPIPVIDGSTWYQQQAFRALNQAIGRAIRHQFDYGAVVLMDERFGQIDTQTQLAKWLRPVIRTRDGIGIAARTSNNSNSGSGGGTNSQRTLSGIPLAHALPQLATFFHHLNWHPPSSSSSSSSSSSVVSATTRICGCSCPICSAPDSVCRNPQTNASGGISQQMQTGLTASSSTGQSTTSSNNYNTSGSSPDIVVVDVDVAEDDSKIQDQTTTTTTTTTTSSSSSAVSPHMLHAAPSACVVITDPESGKHIPLLRGKSLWEDLYYVSTFDPRVTDVLTQAPETAGAAAIMAETRLRASYTSIMQWSGGAPAHVWFDGQLRVIDIEGLPIICSSSN